MATPLIQLARPQVPASRQRAHVLVTVNGPGEIAAWLYPFAHALRQQAPDVTLTAALLPCAFASGREREVLSAMPTLDHVLAPHESMRWIMRGIPPATLPTPPQLTLHFGGELGLAVALARRSRALVAAYEEERVRWPALLDRICVRDERATGGRFHERVRIIGNLMVDAARLRVPRRSSHRQVRTIALLPGSRPYFVSQLLPLFLRAMGRVCRRDPSLRLVLAKSDFVTLDTIVECLKPGADRVVKGDDGEVQRHGSDLTIMSRGGVSVEILSPEQAMASADVAVTIPGTNTAELAALGIPMLLVLPTYRLHALPLPGIAGHLGGIPFLGPMVKEAVARTYIHARRFWAHPNLLAGEIVVPELVGPVTAEAIADALDQLIAEPLDVLRQRLRIVMGSPGASARLVDEALALVAGVA